MSDLPRVELMRMAQAAIDRSAPGVIVHFKFTCPGCGERCTLAEPNVLRESGECWRCGVESPIERGGFMLIIPTGRLTDVQA
jgi:hypothetical protein